MNLLFVADGRSPIALNWIAYFLERGHEVHLISTFSSDPDPHLASYHFVPVAFSSLKAGAAGSSSTPKSAFWNASLVGIRTSLRRWLGPLTLLPAARTLRTLIHQINPDLVHAMRIPYEGMLAALSKPSMPLLISVWGNDFTLHAPATPLMGYFTRLALAHASALHTDCQRDQNLAREWGYPENHPGVVLPGAGGIQHDLFTPGPPPQERQPVVVNPRGVRDYVRNDTFFHAIPLVLARQPATRFICLGMAGEPQILRWINDLNISQNISLLPPQSRPQMAALFQKALIMVSPSTHDGTPNTLLESIACGAFPIAGDIPSLREWITPGENGLLFDPTNPQALAQSILSALENPTMLEKAQKLNRELVEARAAYGQVMQQVLNFYKSLVEKQPSSAPLD